MTDYERGVADAMALVKAHKAIFESRYEKIQAHHHRTIDSVNKKKAVFCEQLLDEMKTLEQ